MAVGYGMAQCQIVRVDEGVGCSQEGRQQPGDRLTEVDGRAGGGDDGEGSVGGDNSKSGGRGIGVHGRRGGGRHKRDLMGESVPHLAQYAGPLGRGWMSGVGGLEQGL